MDLPLAEGLCELFSFLWLTGDGGAAGPGGAWAGTEAERAHRVRAIVDNPDAVYGGGFRAARRSFEACGSSLRLLLDEVRSRGRLPTAAEAAEAVGGRGRAAR